MKMNRRMLFGIISIALAAVIALIGIPAVIGQGNTKINIVTMCLFQINKTSGKEE